MPFYNLGITAVPQGLKQVNSVSEGRGVMFSWKEMQCKERNGVLLGYEIKLYCGRQVHTTTVVESETMFTVVPQWRTKFSYPKAISVAAMNELGAGNHCPRVKINLSGYEHN